MKLAPTAAALLLVPAARGRAVLSDRLPGGGIPGAARAGLREDRRERRRGRAGRSPDGRLHSSPPAQHLLLPLRHRNARRVSAARWPDEEGHDLPPAAQPATGGCRRTRALGRRRRAGQAGVGCRRCGAGRGDGDGRLAAGTRCTRRPPVADGAADAAPRRRRSTPSSARPKISARAAASSSRRKRRASTISGTGRCRVRSGSWNCCAPVRRAPRSAT